MRKMRRLTLAGLATLAGSIGGLALHGAPALAFTFPEAEFTGTYIPVGSLEVPSPTGIAVEASTGDLFVVSVMKNGEPGEAKVLKLSPEGVVLGEFSVQGVSEGTRLSWSVAVDNSCYLQGKTGTACEELDPSNGDVYVANLEYGSGVEKFKPKDGEPNVYEQVGSLPTEGSGQTGVAVDSSGNVYASVFGFHGAIFEFNSKGEELPSLGGSNWTVPNGVAVDEAGNVFVPGVYFSLEPEGIFELGAEGALQCKVAAEVGRAVAVNPASGEVFALEGQSGPVTRYRGECEEANKEQFGEFSEAGAVAYSPHNHDLYVSNYATGEVHVFARGTPGPAPEVTGCEARELSVTGATLACTVAPNGAETTWQFEYKQAGAAKFVKAPEPAGRITGSTSSGEVKVTVDGLEPGSEYLYRLAAVNEHGLTRSPSEGTASFTTLLAVPASACAAGGVTGEAATLTATLTPRVPGAEYHFQYGTSEAYGSSTPVKTLPGTGEALVEEPVAELEPDRTYDCRMDAKDSEGETQGENGTFQTPSVPPVVVVGSEFAPSVGSRSATLSATIDPENNATGYYIEYIKAADYCGSCADPYAGKSNPGEGAGRIPAGSEEPVGSDDSYHLISQTVTGLQPGTAYDFRVVASNGVGSPADGEGAQFTTGARLPELSTGPVEDIGQTGATVTGTVNPEGLETTYVVEFGTSASYGATWPLSPMSAGQGMAPVGVSIPVPYLLAGTTYHYRLVATNEEGTAYGQDQTFTTLPAQAPATGTSSLTLPLAPPLIAVPTIAFPAETGTTTTTTRILTRAQKLARALKACRKRPNKRKRKACEVGARHSYSPPKSAGFRQR
jgi:hypothetical protein